MRHPLRFLKPRAPARGFVFPGTPPLPGRLTSVHLDDGGRHGGTEAVARRAARDGQGHRRTADSGQHGRSGEGDLPREIGTRDEKRRAEKGEAGVTRVAKKDEKGEGNLGGHHGTGKSR